MSAVFEIKTKLAKYPELLPDERKGWISVKPSGDASFEVGLREAPEGYTVFFDGWHEEFEEKEEALETFAMGLSTAVRLKVITRGGRAHCWTVEWRDGDVWRSGSTTGLLFFAFWRKKVVMYLQNTLIGSDAGIGGAA